MVGATPSCTKTRSISCSTDWRLLVPLWRADSLYHELKESHGTYEAAHDRWRDGHKVGADDLGCAPRSAASASTACARALPRSWSGCASGVAAPYGTRPSSCRSACATPPSRRPRGAPPGQTTLDLPV